MEGDSAAVNCSLMPAMANAPYWYIGSTKWTAVSAWASSTATSVGDLVRQNASPTLGDERVFVCIVAGTTGGGEPSWSLDKGNTTTDSSVTWMECTGQPAVNGDTTNTFDWNEAKGNSISRGQIIKNIAATHYFICSTAGTAGNGSEPTWNTTAGQTTSDGGVTWTSLGVVGNFSAWGAPHQRIPNTAESGWGAPGDTFYISNNHAESQSVLWKEAFVTNTQSNPCNYICVNDTASPPTSVATTATVTTTGSNKNISLSATGSTSNDAYFYMYGVTFRCASTGSSGHIVNGIGGAVFEACGFEQLASSSGSIQLGFATAGDKYDIRRDCTFVFSNADQRLNLVSGRVEIIGGSIAATGTAPSTAFSGSSSAQSSIIVRDCDVSGVTGNLVDMGSDVTSDMVFAYCKLNPGVTLATGTVVGAGTRTLRVHNCDSDATNYRMFTKSYWGTSQHDTATYNDAGATDGTTRISWKVETNDNPVFGQPFVTEQIFQWVDTTGSPLTATVEIAGAATLNDDEIWLEIEYMGSSSTPLGFYADSRKADILASNSAVPASSATWTGSPAEKQKLEVTFTPQMKGPIKGRIYVAKRNATVYVDPLITVA